MDIVRNGVVEAKRRRRWLLVVGGVILAAVLGVAVSRLEPAAPTVARDAVWVGTVQRGTLLRQVRGHGTLVPEELRWVQAETIGRVDRVLVEPGQEVAAEEVLLELSNPEVERAAVDADNALRRAEAELASLRMSLRAAALDQQAAAAAVEAEYVRATLQAEADRELADKGLVSAIQLKASEAVAASMVTRREVEAQRALVSEEASRAQIDAKQAELAQQRALARLRQGQYDSLRVRAGIDGVVQELPVEIGQQVAAGTMLARVAQTGRLRAELKVPATRARDVHAGLPVDVDTRNGVVAGTVIRVDPAVREGAVEVEVRLDGPLPEGARPDMAVDGVINIERLDDVVYVGRPVHGQEDAVLGLFRLDSSGVTAQRVQVEIGRVSVDAVEVKRGLAVGDQVILSDTSRWDDSDRIRLR